MEQLAGLPETESARKLAFERFQMLRSYLEENQPLELVAAAAQGWIQPGVQLPEQPRAPEANAVTNRISDGNFRLLNRLLTLMDRFLEISELHKVTKATVGAARKTLVIGEA